MLKDVGDGRRGRAIRSPAENKSPRKKRNRQPVTNSMGRDSIPRLKLQCCMLIFMLVLFFLTHTGFRFEEYRCSSYYISRYSIASQQRPADIMHFPAEYQAPQIVHIDQVRPPAGMSVPAGNGYATTIPNKASVARFSSPVKEARFFEISMNIEKIVMELFVLKPYLFKHKILRYSFKTI